MKRRSILTSLILSAHLKTRAESSCQQHQETRIRRPPDASTVSADLGTATIRVMDRTVRLPQRNPSGRTVHRTEWRCVRQRLGFGTLPAVRSWSCLEDSPNSPQWSAGTLCTDGLRTGWWTTNYLTATAVYGDCCGLGTGTWVELKTHPLTDSHLCCPSW